MTAWAGQVVQLECVTSTMDEAEARARTGAAEGTTVVARAQDGGRGRRGRTWNSPADAGLYLTTILRPAHADFASLGIVVGVAVLESVHALGAAMAQVKWPNDIVVGPRKLGGVLMHALHQPPGPPLVLAGVGVNLTPRHRVALPADVGPRYVGLDELVRSAVPVERLRDTVLDRLHARYVQWTREGLGPALAAWRHFDALEGHHVRVEEHEGRAVGIDAAGGLLLRTVTGTVAVRSGEALVGG